MSKECYKLEEYEVSKALATLYNNNAVIIEYNTTYGFFLHIRCRLYNKQSVSKTFFMFLYKKKYFQASSLNLISGYYFKKKTHIGHHNSF